MVFCAYHEAHADISVLQKLRFGELIITDNDTCHTITVNPNGSFGHSDAIIKITDPQPGIYQIDDLIPNSVIHVNVTQIQPLSGGNNFFTLKDFQVIHTNSDASGLTTVTLGATAETSGNGLPYDSRTYNGTLQIEINF